MTRPALLATAIALGLAATMPLALPAEAQGMGPRGDRPDFATLDADGDGRITEAEMAARRDAVLAERFAAMDADGDGAVTLQEMREAPAARFAARMLERFDADGNDAISRDELKAGADDRRHARGDRMFGRLDADNDGAISAEEFAEMRGGRGRMGGMGRQGGDGFGRMEHGRGPWRE
ncbi:MAG: calcium-binding protein [Paracoccaceae bacterium]|jgi:Ca2+-binding EF-hand superfamily protein|nr:calcium-binding protein [Paracoccaceae bacterium]